VKDANVDEATIGAVTVREVPQEHQPGRRDGVNQDVSERSVTAAVVVDGYDGLVLAVTGQVVVKDVYRGNPSVRGIHEVRLGGLAVDRADGGLGTTRQREPEVPEVDLSDGPACAARGEKQEQKKGIHEAWAATRNGSALAD
jgi:hypothetical protein